MDGKYVILLNFSSLGKITSSQKFYLLATKITTLQMTGMSTSMKYSLQFETGKKKRRCESTYEKS